MKEMKFINNYKKKAYILVVRVLFTNFADRNEIILICAD